MNDLTWAAKVRLVHQRGNYTCEYCQTSQRIIGQAMHVEHIDPQGGDGLENLCLSCSSCNLSKAKAVTARDDLTGTVVPLFHPRTQLWTDHFQWAQSGTVLVGLTAIGRATILRLKINQPRLIDARKVWIQTGLHPP